MEKSRFMHVGITVRDMQRTIDFYSRYFGFEVEIQGVFDKEFTWANHVLYQVPKGTYSNFCYLKSPDGFVLELFEFHPILTGEGAKWDQPGYHHVCLWVPDIFAVCNKMKEDGVKFFFDPGERGNPNDHWVFLKDPDGNMIELQD